MDDLKTILKSVSLPSLSIPIWKGPSKEGLTQSLLQKYIVCKERFRLAVIYGYTVAPSFNKFTGYGDMWHLCEENFTSKSKNRWKQALLKHTRDLVKKYPLQREEISKYYNLCLIQFPVYIEYWKNHSHELNKETLYKEEEFKTPYILPSGDKVILKGKFDGVDIIKEGRAKYILLQENKTKGDTDEKKIETQLDFDLQTMFYLVSLQERLKQINCKYPLKGVKYNIVKRPLSGGRHSIKQLKPTKKNPKGESLKSYYSRLQERIKEEPEFFFNRMLVEVTQKEIDTFKTQFLNPVLQDVCNWWEWITAGDFKDPWSNRVIDGYETVNSIHWRSAYGIYNPLSDNKKHQLDYLLNEGSDIGLIRSNNLFPELENANSKKTKTS